MKIRSDYMDALQRQEQLSKPEAPTDVEAFAALLTGQSSPSTGAEQVATPPIGTKPIDPLMLSALTESPATTDDMDVLAQSVLSQASGVLDSLDGYAQALSSGTGNASTKDMWSLLGGLNDDIQSLRHNVNKLPIGSGLSEMVNELEVLAAAETFKFNRGDYQA